MRVLARVAIDTPTGNAAIKSGALGKVIESTVALVNPKRPTSPRMREAVRVLRLRSQGRVGHPMIAEPWFHELGASVDISPVMVAEDVGRGCRRLLALNDRCGERVRHGVAAGDAVKGTSLCL